MTRRYRPKSGFLWPVFLAPFIATISVAGIVAQSVGLSTVAAAEPVPLYSYQEEPERMAQGTIIPPRAAAQETGGRSGPSLILSSPDIFDDPGSRNDNQGDNALETDGDERPLSQADRRDLESIVRDGGTTDIGPDGRASTGRRPLVRPFVSDQAPLAEGGDPRSMNSEPGPNSEVTSATRSADTRSAEDSFPESTVRELPPSTDDRGPRQALPSIDQPTVVSPRRQSDPDMRSLFARPDRSVESEATNSDAPSRRRAAPEVENEFRSQMAPTPSTTASGHMFASRDASAFVAWLPPNRQSGSSTLVFSMRNSADVLPGQSDVGVFVNGERLGTIGTTADGRGRRLAITLPERYLQDGYNSIEFRASLFHRVACTVESGYDTWVEVPAEDAYVGYDLEGGLDHTAVLGWIGQAMQDRPLPIYSPGRQPQDTVIRAGFSFAQGVSVSTGIEAHPMMSHPLSDIQSDNPSETSTEFPGLDLRRLNGPIAVVMGTAQDLRGVVGSGLLSRVDGPHLSTHRIGDRIIILISGLNGSDIAYAAHGFAEEVAQDQPPWRYFSTIRQNMTRDWATLGARTESAYGPLYRSRVGVNLPANAATTQEQTVRLNLNLAYGPGLADSAELLIMVNGRTAAAYPLSNNEGALLEDRPIDLPMRYFRPGANLIEIEARLPYVDDSECFWRGGPPTEGRPRLTFFEDTSIEFPSFGDTTLLPDLRLFTEEMLPYASSGRMPLLLTSGDHNTVSAAWSFMGALAARSGNVLPVDLQIGGSPSLYGDAVVFGASDELPTVVRERGTGGLRTVLDRWESGVETVDTDWLPPNMGPRRGRTVEPSTEQDTDSVIESLRRLQVSDSDSGRRTGDSVSMALIDGVSRPSGNSFTNGDRSVLGTNGSGPMRATDATSLERDDWRNRLQVREEDSLVDPILGWIGGLSNAVISEAYTNSTDFRMPVWAEADRSDPERSRDSDFVIAQFSPRSWMESLPGVAASTWTVVSAPDSSGLWAGVERLNRIDSINGIGGDTALFDLPDGEISLQKSTTDYVFSGHQGFSLSLFRSVLGQWFSIYVGIWIAFAIAVVIIVGLLSNSLLKSVGQREEIR